MTETLPADPGSSPARPAPTGGCPVLHAGSYPFPRGDELELPPELVRLREEAPVATVTLPSGDLAYLVTRYADVKAVLSHPSMSRDLDRPGAARINTRVGSGNHGNPFADAPVHTRWRRKIARSFTPRQVERFRPVVERIVAERITAMRAMQTPVDFMEVMAYPLPIAVLCHMIGIPLEDHPRFQQWVTVILSEERGSEDRAEAFLEVRDYALALAERLRREPGDDFLSGLVGATDDPLDDDDVFMTVMILLVAGYKTTAAELGKAMVHLARHPDQLERLRADPSLATTAVHELLRFTPPGNGLGLPRYATRDVRIGGVLIPAGSTIMCARHVANRDELHFTDGDRLDLSRPDAHQHLTFGAGRAYCFGAPVAEMEIEIALRELFTAFPDIVVDGDVTWQETMAIQVPTRLEVSWT